MQSELDRGAPAGLGQHSGHGGNAHAAGGHHWPADDVQDQSRRQSPRTIDTVMPPRTPSAASRTQISEYGSRASRKSQRKAALDLARQHQQHRREAMSTSWPDPRKYNERSLGYFLLDHPLRRGCIWCIEWKWWDRIVLGVIFLNTIQLAIYDPFDVPDLRPSPQRRDGLDVLSKVCLCFLSLPAPCAHARHCIFSAPSLYLSLPCIMSIKSSCI
jgi:hypothetical protein